jgi:hypothetical protein
VRRDAQMKTERVRLFGFLMLAASVLAASGCLKVKPTPYQVGLKAYYSALLSGKSEESLKAAIANLDKELAKSPSDPGMLALRASAHLDLLRLGVQKPERTFDAEYADSLFRDLRLLQTHAEEATAKLWLKPRLNTMAGDAFLLRAESLPPPPDANRKESLILSARQGAFYQLAADFYQHAWAAAQVQATGEDATAENIALAKEKDNARDGYVNAVSGISKTKRVLGFSKEARQLSHQAIGLLTTDSAALPAPDPNKGLTPGSLYAYSHAILKTQYESIEVLTRGNYAERVSFKESALKEDLLSRMLQSKPDLGFSGEAIATQLLTYYGALTAQTKTLSATGGGNVNTEVVSFQLLPGAAYVASNVNAVVEYLTLAVGEDKVRVELNDVNVPPEGVSVTIHSRTGSSSGDSPSKLERFLNRSSSFFATGAQVQVLVPGDNPGDNVIGSVVAQ